MTDSQAPSRLDQESTKRYTTMAGGQGRNLEQVRLEEARDGKAPWKKWGPYLSERQWGTVREDYSPNGDAWNFFTHDHARSRAYRKMRDSPGRLKNVDTAVVAGLRLYMRF